MVGSSMGNPTFLCQCVHRLSAQDEQQAEEGDACTDDGQANADALIAPAVSVERAEKKQQEQEPQQLRGQIEQELRETAAPRAKRHCSKQEEW